MLILVVVPLGLAAGVAIGAARQVSQAGARALIAAVVGAAIGLALPPMLQAFSTARDRERSGGRALPRWFTPLLIVGVGSVPLWPLLGHTDEACLLALCGGFLVSFAVLAAGKMRSAARGSSHGAPTDAS